MKALPSPNDAVNAPDAVEVLRGWIVNGDLRLSLAFQAFGNSPETWGQLLAEAAAHIADAMSARRVTGTETPSWRAFRRAFWRILNTRRRRLDLLRLRAIRDSEGGGVGAPGTPRVSDLQRTRSAGLLDVGVFLVWA